MRKISLFFVLLLTAMPLTASVEVMPGDVNGDGVVNIADVSAMIDYILHPDASVIDTDVADLDGDGEVGIADVVGLIDLVLEAQDTPIDDGHEWVDLGLPSGTLWATCNVGATTPEEYGDYFAWGETKMRNDFWDEYTMGGYMWSWWNHDYGMYSLSKYCTDGSYGSVDNKTELDVEDDAAYVNWGHIWRMPSTDQIKELINNCSSTWAQQNGVDGWLFTGSNGNTMFLPLAGYLEGYSIKNYDAGVRGYYWSRTLYPGPYLNDFYSAYSLLVGLGPYSTYCNVMDEPRYWGCTVRAVRMP